MTLRKKSLKNIVGKGEDAGNQHFLLFPHNVFYPSGNKFQFFNGIYFVAFNLDQSQIFSFGEELNGPEKKAFENIVEKEKMLITSIFSSFHNVFLLSHK